MRPLSQLEMHRRKHGKGSGTDTFDIRFGHSRHVPGRVMTVQVFRSQGWNRLRVSLNLNRKPTTEELERIRTLFLYDDEQCLSFVPSKNQACYVDLWEPPRGIKPPIPFT
jgi:hypothetical protein